MHMPKSNTFAYICCMLLGVAVIYLGATGRFQDALGNIILMIIGARLPSTPSVWHLWWMSPFAMEKHQYVGV